MIDTDQYEGHTPTEEWGDIVYATDIDRRLMADAPLLLAEVKRLQKRSKKLENALLTLADGAGDVPMFNKGGEAYEALWGDEE